METMEFPAGAFQKELAAEHDPSVLGRKDISMRISDVGKSWLLGLAGGAVLAGIHLFLFPSLYTRDLLRPLGVLVAAYVCVSAISAWIVSWWTHSWDAGFKAGWITGLGGGIGAFGGCLLFLLLLTHGQLFGGRAYALSGLFAFLPFCLLGICLSLGGALLGCKVAHVEG